MGGSSARCRVGLTPRLLLPCCIGPLATSLTCIFVNNGLLRLEEAERVQATFRRGMGLNLEYVDTSERFVSRLAGVTDPETKRKVIGEEFIRVFEEAASGLGEIEFLAQGTLYPDVIESEASPSSGPGLSARIKTHHNVGGLPENMKLQLVEPLRYLFKDEVRDVGLELGLPPDMVYRQPFPGSGSRHPGNWRGHAGKAGYAAGLRLDRD